MFITCRLGDGSSAQLETCLQEKRHKFCSSSQLKSNYFALQIRRALAEEAERDLAWVIPERMSER